MENIERVLYTYDVYTMRRWSESDSDGQMGFAIVSPSGRIEMGVGSDKPSRAFKMARGMCRSISRETRR